MAARFRGHVAACSAAVVVLDPEQVRSANGPRIVAADAIRALGHPGYVSEPGEWGPLINGGAWLTVDGIAVDVLYRDLDVVEQRVADARAGRFEAMLADAVLSVAHARLAARREWVFNEKRLVERAGLQAVAPLVASSEVAGVAELLGVAPLRPR